MLNLSPGRPGGKRDPGGGEKKEEKFIYWGNEHSGVYVLGRGKGRGPVRGGTAIVSGTLLFGARTAAVDGP